MSYRLAFAGTPRFAVPALLALAQDPGYTISGVFTQPDRPAGRGKKTTACAVKIAAETLALPVFQPEKLRDADLAPLLPLDALIVVAFGQILPESLLNTPRFGSLNLHASLLPRWRGAAPIARAILAGDRETGVGIMQMTAGLDAGAVFAQVPLPIAAQDTAESLEEKLAAAGAALLLSTLPLIFSGKLSAQAQAPEGICYAKKLKKSEAALDWSQSAQAIDRQVRAFFPYPVAASNLGSHTVRIFRGAVHSLAPTNAPPGQILAVDKAGLTVACGQGSYHIQELQVAGGKRLAAWDFAQGQRQSLIGQIFTAPALEQP
jgi:methionyl-tRNA formyltransferase